MVEILSETEAKQPIASAMGTEINLIKVLTASAVYGGTMSHSLVNVWVHGIFGTKDRTALIKNSFEPQLHKHIKDKLETELGCKVRIINGTEDHIHLLFLLSPGFSLKDIFQNV